MAEAAYEGASGEPDVTVRLCPAETSGADALLSADGLIFVAPENLAALSGPMKDFFDRSYYPALGQIEGRPYAVMICAGSDGSNAVRQIGRIATGWRLRPIAEPVVVCTFAQTPAAVQAEKALSTSDLERCRTVGACLAAGLAAGIF